jgi:hypothetical protein
MMEIPEASISCYAVSASSLRCEANFLVPIPKERSTPGHPETWPADRVAPAVHSIADSNWLSPQPSEEYAVLAARILEGLARAGAGNEPGLIHGNPVATLRKRSSVSLPSAMVPSMKTAKPAVVAKLEHGIPVFT